MNKMTKERHLRHLKDSVGYNELKGSHHYADQ